MTLWRCYRTGLVIATLTAAPVVSAQYATGILVHAEPVRGVRMEQARSEQNHLTALVSVSLREVPLVAAIEAIAKQSGTKIVITDGASRIEQRVTIEAQNVKAVDAFASVLRGTPVHMSTMESGRILFALDAAVTRQIGTLTGRIVNAKTQQPVGNATISVEGDTVRATTSSTGTFRMALPAGTHTVHIRALGFIRQTRSVTISAGDAQSVDVALQPSASVLDEVVVTGTVIATERKAIPNPITVITAEEIEQRGITRIEQFFRGEVPGVIALDKGTAAYDGAVTDYAGSVLGGMVSSNVYARGASRLSTTGTNPLKTYIDGVEIVDPSYLGSIDPQSIERIEIITGPQASTVYGSGAMGGVMQIFTKKGGANTSLELGVSLRYGMLESSYGTGRTPQHHHSASVAGGSGPGFSYSGNLSYTYTGQWQPGLFSSRFGGSIGLSHTQDALGITGSFSTTQGENGAYDGAWAAGNPWYRSRIASGEILESGCCARISDSRLSSSNNYTASLSATYRFSQYLSNILTIGRSQNIFDVSDNRPQFWFPNDTMLKVAGSSSLRQSVSYNLNILTPPFARMSSTISVGFDGTWVNSTSVRGCLPTKESTGYTGCYGGFSVSTAVTRSIPGKSTGGFARWQLGLFDELFLTLGIRGERNPSYGRSHATDWTPSNGLAYTKSIGDMTFKLLGSYGRATRPPNTEWRLQVLSLSSGYDPPQYVSQFEAPDLTPEYSRGPQAGIEMYYGGVASLILNHYQQKVTDLIQRVPVDSFFRTQVSTGNLSNTLQYQYLNAATIRQQGWEGTGTLNIGYLSVKGTYSWNDSEVLRVHPRLASSASWYPGRGHFGIPTHTGFLSVTYAYGGTSIGLTTNYIGKYTRVSSLTELGLTNGNARLTMYTSSRKGGGYAANLPRYAKSNVTASHQVKPWMTLTLNIDNVTNSYDSDADVTAATLGRQTFFGLSLRRPIRR